MPKRQNFAKSGQTGSSGITYLRGRLNRLQLSIKVKNFFFGKLFFFLIVDPKFLLQKARTILDLAFPGPKRFFISREYKNFALSFVFFLIQTEGLSEAHICPIIKQIWLLPFMQCLYCFTFYNFGIS